MENVELLDHMVKAGAPGWYIRQFFPGYCREEFITPVLREERALQLPPDLVVMARKAREGRRRKTKVVFKGGQVSPREYAAMTVLAATVATKVESFKPEWQR